MIARAIGSLATVEPVLPSRYEPATDSPPMVEMPREETQSRTLDQNQETLEQRTGPANVKVGRERPAETGAVESSVRYKGDWRGPARRQEPGVRPEIERTIDAVPGAMAGREIQQALSGSPRLDSPIAAPMQAAARQSSDMGIDVRMEIATPAAAAPVIPPARRSGAPIEMARSENSFARRRESEIRSPAIPQRVEVHVSIGHIEVRQPAPAQPRPRQAAKPQLSLDDYLRRRDGAAR
ncbi:MAG TPA: hypothetical protein VLY04_17310 [Bryobacteraceae bacterium]|nr:hypothetical protein [Bryobacteraceae bacterium]